MRTLSGLVLAVTFALPACGAQPAKPSPPPVEAKAAPSASASAAPAPAEEKSAAPIVSASASASAAPTAAPVVSAAPSAPPPPVAELLVVAPSPGPAKMPSLAITAPTRNQVIPTAKAGAFALKLKVTGWELGASGNRLCVRIDKHRCHAVTDLKAPLTLKEIDPSIDDGQHVLTVLAQRASGELIKPAGKSAAFASLSFFVGKKIPPVWKDGDPMIFFDPPADGPAPEGGVVLDFYVANTEIAAGKYQIQASVGGPGLGAGAAMILDALTPLRIKNAQPGEYLVRLALLGRKAELGESSSSTTVSFASTPIGGAFSEVTRSFRVTGSLPSH
jgi:hypothetical protein